jgi:hypothetical protein
LFLLISVAVRALYVYFFHNCFSFDLKCWDQVGDILMSGGNPYHLTSFLSWSPFWMQLIFLFKKISLALHVPFNDIVRIFLIGAECLLALLLYISVIRYVKSSNPVKLLVFGIALNPISIFEVCQHCNFDVLVGFWILLAIYMLLRFQEQTEPRFWLCACFALGMGILTKTVPICLSPLLLLSVRKLKLQERLLGVAFLLGPSVLGLCILYVLGPQDIQAKVLGYRSVPGFGFTGLFMYFGLTRLLAAWRLIFEAIYGIGWLWVGVWLWSKEKLNPEKIVLLAIVLLMAIPAFGPGYGPQYIYWYLPLLILEYGFGNKNARIFLLVLYIIAAATYTVEYAFNFNTLGAFFLEIFQTSKLLSFGLWISTQTHDTFVYLPLWICYLITVVFFGLKIIRAERPDLNPQKAS